MKRLCFLILSAALGGCFQHNANWYFDRGVEAADNAELAVALDYFRRADAIDPDNPSTAFNIGVCCLRMGDRFDEVQAWWSKAAELGSSEAAYRLGYCLHQGYGGEPDYEQAVHWFLRAAEQGHPVAQVMLGSCCIFGRGTEKSNEKALFWYGEAARQGDPDGKFFLEHARELVEYEQKTVNQSAVKIAR